MNNQIRGNGIIQSAGWFNLNGERLGGGDLTIQDMHNISKNLLSSEAFFALTEMDASWDLPSHLDRTAPGFTYILQKAAWAMVRGQSGGVIIRVRDDISKSEETEKDGVKFIRIPRNDFYKAFGYDNNGIKIPKMSLVKKTENKDAIKKDVATSPVAKTSGTIPAPPAKRTIRRTYTGIKPTGAQPATKPGVP